MEELVKRIQQGHTELYSELWEQVKDLIAWFAVRYINAFLNGGKRLGIEVDDLIQAGFFAVHDAVENYDPACGAKFTTYLSYHIKKQFRIAIGRTDKQINDVLNYALSLDAPVCKDDPDRKSSLDRVPDPYDGIAAVEDRIYLAHLHSALEAALATLPEQQAEAIRSVYWDGCTLKETADKMNCSLSYVRTLRESGLHRIRYSSAKKQLEQFLDDQTDFYKNTGLSSYNQTQTSQVERLVMRREYLRKHYSELKTGEE